MHDQASRLRNLVRRSPWPADSRPTLPRVITVAGGKPGSGCTTIAINVAAAMAQQGWRTVLIDGDEQCPEMVSRLNLKSTATLADVLAGRCNVHEALLAAPAGLQVVAGSPLASPDVAAAALLSSLSITPLLTALCPHADLVVVDAGSASDAWSQTLWNEAERVLLVAAADAPAIMESYATIKRIWRRGMNAAVQILVNQENDAATAADIHGRLDRSCRRFLNLALEPGPALPYSPALLSTAAGRIVLGGDHAPPVGPILERLADALVSPAVTLSIRPAA